MEWDLEEAATWEACQEAEDIDDFRKRRMNELLWTNSQLNAEKDQWCATAPDEISQLVGDINGPLIRYLMTQVVMDDKQLLHDLHEGFPVLGMMPKVGYGKSDDS